MHTTAFILDKNYDGVLSHEIENSVSTHVLSVLGLDWVSLETEAMPIDDFMEHVTRYYSTPDSHEFADGGRQEFTVKGDAFDGMKLPAGVVVKMPAIQAGAVKTTLIELNELCAQGKQKGGKYIIFPND